VCERRDDLKCLKCLNYLATLRRRMVPVERIELAWAAASIAGYDRLTVHGADIMREPRFGSARAVWAHRRFRVDPGMRLAIVGTLHDDGPLRFGELCQDHCPFEVREFIPHV
jgi:hypothetical protein